MAAHISREEYLKRYLSGENTTDNVKKKRRKKKQVQANDKILPRSTIVDDDVDFNSLLPENIENTLEEDVGDNDPTVAEFIDERPEHVKQLENYRHNERWTILGKSADKKEFFVLNQSDSDGVESPVHRNQRHDSDSDQSPPRRQNNNSDSDQSPPRRKRKDSDSDQSPPRKHRKHDSDSDQSPPRKHRKHDSDSDQSPPRKHIKHDSDSDQSPPRRKSCQSAHKDYKLKNIEEEKRHSKQSVINKDSDPDVCRKRSKCEYGNSKNVAKPTKTLGGAKAGLSSAKEMRAEADKIKSKEEDAFKKIGASKLGRDTITVFRDKSGRKRNLREEQEKQSEEDARKAEEIEKYKKWGQGLKQREEQQKSLTEAIHEASKPLARYKDDDDLDEHLRNMERSEDPMLAFIKKKKSKESNKPEKPRYKGPMPPPNRYNIMPGYRWDGVNRSNGFEAKIFSKIAEQKAMKSMAYKWSVEEM